MALVRNNQHLNAVSIGANYTPTTTCDLSMGDLVAVHLIWTGTPTGNAIVEWSNDGINWDAQSTNALGGAAGNKLINVGLCGAAFMRVRYAFTSGTGTLTAWVTASSLN